MNVTLLMQMMLMAQAKSTSLDFVGSEPSWMSGSGTGATATSQVVLPAGCNVGDTALLSCAGQTPFGFAWIAPPDATAAMPATVFGINVAVVYAYTLKQADVDAGTVAVSYTANAGAQVSGYVQVDVYRNASVDVVGTTVSGTTAAATEAVRIPGITTPRDEDMLQYAVFLSPSGGSVSVTPPTGWVASPSINSFGGFVGTAHREQTTAGATGDASATVSYSASGINYLGIMLALRLKAAAIILTINLPAPKIGVAYTGSITATNTDGATGAITITATPLPDGLSAGTVVDNGDGSYTLPITGTPTTAQSVDVGISATNGPQSASAMQTLVAAAPAASPIVVQRVTAGTGSGAAKTSQVITLPSAPTPDNYLVALTSTYFNANSAPPTPPDASWTEWALGANLVGARKVITDAFVHEVVAGDGTAYTFTFPKDTNIAIALYEISGTTGVITSLNRTATNTALSPQEVVAPAEAGNAFALAWFVKQGSADAAANAGWTKDLYQPTSNGSMTTFTGVSVADTPTTLTVTDSGTDVSWSANILLLGPAP